MRIRPASSRADELEPRRTGLLDPGVEQSVRDECAVESAGSVAASSGGSTTIALGQVCEERLG